MTSKLKHIALKGSGYFCDVIQYRNELNGQDYALKVLKKEHYSKESYRYRLIREIKLLDELKECNCIIDLIKEGNDKENEKLWYLMPYASNNLYKFIKSNNCKLELKQRFIIADQVIEAIRYAHSKNILHRDISPNNVLIFENDIEKIKVCDFGLGKDQESLSFYTGSSASGYGQILYVSPEQRDKLKDATVQSDIYSLGKLIYFIFTGKDPDNIKTFELSSLVSKSIEDNPAERFSDMEELYNHYEALKKLQFSDEIPIEYITLKEIVESKGEIDWIHFHQLAIKGNYSNHVYSDYIKPVVSILNSESKVSQYYNSSNSDILSFAITLTQRIKECIGTLGWPFREIDSFGELLKNIIIAVEINDVRLICFKQLWYLAFVSDQWAVQSTIKEILTKEYVTDSIQLPFALYIQEQATEIDMSHFDNLSIPEIIKKGIISSNNSYKKAEEVRIKKQKEDITNLNF